MFAACDGKSASIVRFTATWWELRDEPNVFPVTSIKQIEPLLARMPNLKAIFYPANNGTNLQAIRNTNYNHVFLGHGDSNKTSSANKVFRLYDEVWVAGHAHLDRFKRIPGNYSGIDFKVIGQPWMRDWLAALPDYSQSERKDWGYFPTWRGYYANTNYSSLDLTPEIVKVAQDCLSGSGFLKLHPWSS
ncbi:MAG: hypothetical protein GY883_17585, partial [Shimia sp.]|nr:hypothetical protein [Shimia sp.]